MSKYHYKAYLTNFELACEGGIIALVADLVWLLHDIIYNGINFFYCFTGCGLLIGILITVYAMYRHHVAYVHRMFKKQNKRVL